MTRGRLILTKRAGHDNVGYNHIASKDTQGFSDLKFQTL
jgi:hypothetical protein